MSAARHPQRSVNGQLLTGLALRSYVLLDLQKETVILNSTQNLMHQKAHAVAIQRSSEVKPARLLKQKLFENKALPLQSKAVFTFLMHTKARLNSVQVPLQAFSSPFCKSENDDFCEIIQSEQRSNKSLFSGLRKELAAVSIQLKIERTLQIQN